MPKTFYIMYNNGFEHVICDVFCDGILLHCGCCHVAAYIQLDDTIGKPDMISA